MAVLSLLAQGDDVHDVPALRDRLRVPHYSVVVFVEGVCDHADADGTGPPDPRVQLDASIASEMVANR